MLIYKFSVMNVSKSPPLYTKRDSSNFVCMELGVKITTSLHREGKEKENDRSTPNVHTDHSIRQSELTRRIHVLLLYKLCQT